MTKRAWANVWMTVSKIGSGLNENALKYLLPRWMNAVSGVVMRVGFASLAFWIVSFFVKPKNPVSAKDIFKMLLMGAVLVYGYMICLLEGLTYTTPVSSSLIACSEPVIVFVISLILLSERATKRKILGLCLGIGGALVCILSQKQSDVATNPLLGNLLCVCCSIIYSIYLILSKRFLSHIDMISFNKWTFMGAAIVGIIVASITGWSLPVLEQKVFSAPFLILAFVLFIPSTVSYFLVDIGLRNLSTTVVALYGYLILIVAMVVSYITGQDHFHWIQMVSVGMIVASVYFVEIAEEKTDNEKKNPQPSK